MNRPLPLTRLRLFVVVLNCLLPHADVCNRTIQEYIGLGQEGAMTFHDGSNEAH